MKYILRLELYDYFKTAEGIAGVFPTMRLSRNCHLMLKLLKIFSIVYKCNKFSFIACKNQKIMIYLFLIKIINLIILENGNKI